jgi:hypothetical protein
MIITAILNLLYTFISFVLLPLSLMSDVSLNSAIETSLATANGYYRSLDVILPMDTILQILGVVLTLEGAYLIYKVIMWVIKKVPTLN